MKSEPNIIQVEENLNYLSDKIIKTPVLLWDTPIKEKLFGQNINIYNKLELLQKTGTFKIRGALTFLKALSKDENFKKMGVVAGTGGNHGVAVAYAAKLFGISAKIIVPKTINPFRLEAIKTLGAEIVVVDHIAEIIDRMNEISKNENRQVVHPFNSPEVTLGTATLGLEFIRQVPDLDVVIVPIGGGGLASGVSSAIKQINPNCKVYGVEPINACCMKQSLNIGKAMRLSEKPISIADSLCSPCTEEYSFEICRKYLDDVVLVSDQELVHMMKVFAEDMKLMVEPAGVTAMAGLYGPLKERCANLKAGVVVCGSNIDHTTFNKILNV